ncbi:unnamed protein product [Lathyrus oleraceus]|uniref:uncharacterized protein LOC127112616 n=1 Tax=Pisum sativum TaxID=3888 RepID=UPI001FC3E5CC|nr:uncharacterized protein LOC127112616 [Pisum sativum]XP_050902650.1 uncharacterized protein LOC127114978 [Pisum sativum]XP_050920072.1 uncharacterized protein LOC127137678 [Pisum sativum]XP_050920073.1 uncharacterized protein LOC127137679 [Pisum sativum]
MTIPLSMVDDVAIFDLCQQHHGHNMLPVYVLFDSRTMSHNHPTRTPHWSVIDQARIASNLNNVSSTVSVVDETVIYDSPMGNVPRRSRINHQTGHPRHHHNNGTRASPPVIRVQNTRPSPVVIPVQDTSQHLTTSTTDAESICCICLVDLSNGSSTPIRLRCSHLFHSHCIQKWNSIKKTCPLCRANV